MSKNTTIDFEFLENMEKNLRLLEDFGDFVEVKIKKEARYNNELKRKYDKGEFRIISSDRYTIDFVNILRSSWLISIYAFSENILSEICIEHSVLKGLPFNKKTNDGVIKDIENYLIRVDKEHFSEYKTEFKFLNQARLIRNCFAHNGGKISKVARKEKIPLLENVDVTLQNKLTLNENYCYELIDNISGLIKGIKEWIYEASI